MNRPFDAGLDRARGRAIKVKLVSAGRSKPMEMSDDLDVDDGEICEACGAESEGDGEPLSVCMRCGRIWLESRGECKMNTEFPTIHPELFEGDEPSVFSERGRVVYRVCAGNVLNVAYLSERDRHRLACENIVLYERDVVVAKGEWSNASYWDDYADCELWSTKRKAAEELAGAWRKWMDE